ncbi:MAG TPA: hypothetical protein V6D26_15670, partial [Stenomitos sp.]
KGYYSLRFPRRVVLGTPSASARKQAIKMRMRSTSGIDDVIVEEIDHLVDSHHRAIDCSRWDVGRAILGWSIDSQPILSL